MEARGKDQKNPPRVQRISGKRLLEPVLNVLGDFNPKVPDSYQGSEFLMLGNLAPSVQISVHPIDSGGILALPPLLKCDDEAIREGIKAMLAERAFQVEAIEQRRATENWTSFQLADRLLLDRLRGLAAEWSPYSDSVQREAALRRYRDYAYQWY